MKKTLIALILTAPLVATAQVPAGATSSQPLTTTSIGRTLLFVSPVVHIGTQPKAPTNIKDGGSAPFLVMFQRLLPAGWTVWQGTVTEPLPQAVTWSGGKPWFDILGEVLVANSLRAEVNWNDKTVVLYTQRLTPAPTNAPIIAIRAPQPVNVTQAPANAPAAPTPKPDVMTWAVTPGDATLRNVMNRWAKDAEWTLVYDASNYAFDSYGEFEGEYKTVVCKVLANINASLAETKKSAPLNAGFWNGNRTVRVFDVRPDNAINPPETCNAKATASPKAEANSILKGNA